MQAPRSVGGLSRQAGAGQGGCCPAAVSEAPWKQWNGAKRLQAEFKSLLRSIAAGQLPQVHDPELVRDDIFRWRFKLRGFDDDVPGGRALNADLARLAASHGMDHLLMEASFPATYPREPFFLRMIRPRCVWYTGHVTAGGSICIEALTLSGTPGSWQASFCVEAVLQVVITNMILTESVVVRTATGPGGVSGPLRIDLHHRYTHNVMSEYSEAEARSAFQRMQSHHAANGWGPPAGGAAGAAATGAAAAGPSNSRAAAAAAAAAAASAAAGTQDSRAPHVQAGSGAGRAVFCGGSAAGPSRPLAGVQQQGQPARGRSSGPLGPLPAQRSPAGRTINFVDTAIELTSAPQPQGRLPFAAAPAPVRQGRPPSPPTSPGSPRQAPAARRRTAPGGGGAIDLTLDSSDEEYSRYGRAAGLAAAASRAAAGAGRAGPSPRGAGATPDSKGGRQQGLPAVHGSGAGPLGGLAPGGAAPVGKQPQARPTEQDPAPRKRAKGHHAGAGGAGRADADLVDLSLLDSQPAEGEGGDDLALLLLLPDPPARPPGGQRRAQEAADAALAKLMAENEQLRRRNERLARAAERAAKEAVEALTMTPAAAPVPAGMLQAPPPPHWAPFLDGEQGFKLVELPLPGSSDDGPDVNPAALTDMLTMGVPKDEAVASLRAAAGALDAAYQFYMEHMDKRGGALAAWERQRGGDPAQAARRKALQDEAASVLQRFQATLQGAGNIQVASITRIQNLKLWTKYCLRSSEVAEAAGASGLNEHSLWHGTAWGALGVILHDGFDHRVANMGGALGAGTYFAHDSAYSVAYSNGANAAAALAAANVYAPATYAPPPAGGGKRRRGGRNVVAPPPPPALPPPPPGVMGMAGMMMPFGPAGAALYGAGGMVPAGGAAAYYPPPPQAPSAGPRVKGTKGMLLCSVVLGRVGQGTAGLRRPPQACDSVTNLLNSQLMAPGKTFAVFDNTQACPSYLVAWQ